MTTGNLNILIASIQVRQQVSVSKYFSNEKELIAGLKEFIDSEGIQCEFVEAENKTIVTKLY